MSYLCLAVSASLHERSREGRSERDRTRENWYEYTYGGSKQFSFVINYSFFSCRHPFLVLLVF
jgi:hypothetical protein